jgi:hypothetical protein
MLAGMGGSCLLAPSHRGLLSLSDSPKSVGASPSLFEQVLPSSSGITWKHVSGRSSASYLPEATGAGCAFIDYDNDGWMDIYLINSGRCDFYDPSPPLRNALYRNNRDGSFTDVTQKTWCFWHFVLDETDHGFTMTAS